MTYLRVLVASLVAASLFTTTLRAEPLNPRITRVKKAPAQTAAPRTPKPGSAERKAILNAYRKMWLKGSNFKGVVFVVPWIRVYNGWAYIVVNPQSPDGNEKYESEAALLRLQKGKWNVLERLGGEQTCDLPCLQRKHPGMPMAIYPVS